MSTLTTCGTLILTASASIARDGLESVNCGRTWRLQCRVKKQKNNYQTITYKLQTRQITYACDLIKEHQACLLFCQYPDSALTV